jgi:hypothetical protein
VHKEWLAAAGDCPKIYEIYLKMIVDVVGAKTIDIDKTMLNTNSCIVKVR